MSETTDIAIAHYALPAMLAVLVAATAVAVFLHLLSRRVNKPFAIATMFVARVVFVAVMWWSAAHAIEHFVRLTGPLPIWLLAVVGGVLTEVLIAILRTEKAIVPRRSAIAFSSLRTVSLILLGLVVAAPVWSSVWQEPVEHVVAILVDDSQSMHVTNPEPTLERYLWEASRAGFEIDVWPSKLLAGERALADLAARCDEQAAAIDRIARAEANTAQRQLQELRPQLRETQEGIAATAKSLAGAIQAALSRSPSLDAALRSQLKRTQDRLRELAKQEVNNTANDDVGVVAEQINRWRAPLQRIRENLTRPIEAAGQAYIASLPEVTRQQLRSQAESSRAHVAKRLLTESVTETRSLVDELQDRYQVRAYRFASDAQQTDTTNDTLNADSSNTNWRSTTNLTAGLTRIAEDIPLDRLSGVIVLSDGLDHDPDAVAPVAALLRAAGVKTSSIVIGSPYTFRDVAVAEMAGPATVLLGDKTTLTARIKCHGFAGRKVRVRLLHEGKQVDRQDIDVTEARFDKEVLFEHLPRAMGVQSYRIELAVDGRETPNLDTVPINDTAEYRVAVTDDRIQLLVIEQRPRWEFRYLKNQFFGRNKAVHLQYLLVRPDRIENQPAPPQVAVSVSRATDQADANALPTNKEEWMKFDVIVLGDVAPDLLDAETQEMLANFVSQRGGTLLTLAGPNYMPHSYRGTRLAEVLPIECSDSAAPKSDEEMIFHLSLTPTGAEHPLMRLADDAEQSATLWETTPEFFWRHTGCRAKPAAEILAFAESRNTSQATKRHAATAAAAQQSPLIVTHRYGAGQVMSLTFDETWRMRYRVGEKHHARFWNQTLRWAAADKLPAGTPRVRLGTDRAHYELGQTLRVRAKLTDAQGDAVMATDIEAKLIHDDVVVRTATMHAEPDQPGRYAVELGKLTEPGIWRVELAGEAVRSLLNKDDENAPSIDVLVGTQSSIAELVNLEADDTVLRQVADLTGGKVVDVFHADEIMEQLGPPTHALRREHLTTAWDGWPMLITIVVVLSLEWIIRRKAGLV